METKNIQPTKGTAPNIPPPVDFESAAAALVGSVTTAGDRRVKELTANIAAAKARKSELRPVLDETREAFERHRAAQDEIEALDVALSRDRQLLKRARVQKDSADRAVNLAVTVMKGSGR